LATRRGAFLRRAAGSGQQCRYRGCWRRPPSLSSAQARWARETDVTVALTLRRTGLSSPAYRDWLDYVIVEDGRDVGRLYEDRHSRPEYRWFGPSRFTSIRREALSRAAGRPPSKRLRRNSWPIGKSAAVIRLLAAPLCFPDAPVRHQQTSAADMQGRISNFVRVWTQHAPLHKSAWERSRVAPGALRGSHGKAMCPHLPPASLDHRSARIDSKAKHAIMFQEGTETSSKKLSVSLFAATQVATHPGISSSDDQDMMGRVRYGSPNAC